MEFPTREELNAPTNAEIAEIAANMPEIERERLTNAAAGMYIAKMRSVDKTPWRELVRLYRMQDPVRVKAEVVDDDGTPRILVTVTQNGYGLKSDAALMFNAIEELSNTLRKIEEFNPGAYDAPMVRKAINTEKARGPRVREKKDYLDIWEYVAPKMRRGEMMKNIVADAVKHFEGRPFSDRKITRAIKWARENPEKLSADS